MACPSQAVILEFVSGAAAALDEYSSFLTGGQMDELFSQIEGNFVGLGVELKTEPTGLSIVNVIPGGPAHAGGIRAGDLIVAVDGKTPADTAPDTLADMLRGVEGTQVAVSVRKRRRHAATFASSPAAASKFPASSRSRSSIRNTAWAISSSRAFKRRPAAMSMRPCGSCTSKG